MNKERLSKLVALFTLLGLDFSCCGTDDEKLAKIMANLDLFLIDSEEWEKKKIKKGLLNYVFGKRLSTSQRRIDERH